MAGQYPILLKVPAGNPTFIAQIVFHFLLIYSIHYKGFPEIQSQSHWKLNKMIGRNFKCPSNNLLKNVFTVFGSEWSPRLLLSATLLLRMRCRKCLVRLDVTWLLRLGLAQSCGCHHSCCQLDAHALSPSSCQTRRCKTGQPCCGGLPVRFQ